MTSVPLAFLAGREHKRTPTLALAALLLRGTRFRYNGRKERLPLREPICLLALDLGWSVEETATRLMQESTKAQEYGGAYALRTAQSAAAAIERRGGELR